MVFLVSSSATLPKLVSPVYISYFNGILGWSVSIRRLRILFGSVLWYSSFLARGVSRLFSILLLWVFQGTGCHCSFATACLCGSSQWKSSSGSMGHYNDGENSSIISWTDTADFARESCQHIHHSLFWLYLTLLLLTTGYSDNAPGLFFINHALGLQHFEIALFASTIS